MGINTEKPQKFSLSTDNENQVEAKVQLKEHSDVGQASITNIEFSKNESRDSSKGSNSISEIKGNKSSELDIIRINFWQQKIELSNIEGTQNDSDLQIGEALDNDDINNENESKLRVLDLSKNKVI